jgi:hypothetical protein
MRHLPSGIRHLVNVYVHVHVHEGIWHHASCILHPSGAAHYLPLYAPFGILSRLVSL